MLNYQKMPDRLIAAGWRNAPGLGWYKYFDAAGQPHYMSIEEAIMSLDEILITF